MPEKVEALLAPELWWSAAWTLGLLLVAAAAGLIAHRLIFAALVRWSNKTESVLDDAIMEHLRRPLAVVVPLLAVTLALPFSPLEGTSLALLRQLHSIALTAALAWAVLRMVRVVEDSVLCNYDMDGPDNFEARAVYTQVRVFKNVAVFLTLVVGTGIALMTFPQVQQIGVSLLASAGVAGVVIGFAAQRSIATLIAGIQIAFTQPIRLEDVVIVESEWGRIEEITLTYVVVRIWDKRRLVVPITYFIEKPFQNWTRSSADLLGTVSIYTDFTVPVEQLRRAYLKILEDSGLWDGEVATLQVVDCTERTMHCRALLSAPDSGRAWDLRCHVREALIEWLREHHPQALPTMRVEMGTATPDATEDQRPRSRVLRPSP